MRATCIFDCVDLLNRKWPLLSNFPLPLKTDTVSNSLVLHFIVMISMGQMRNTRMKELESITEEYQIQNEDLERTNETLSTEMLQCKTKITQVRLISIF